MGEIIQFPTKDTQIDFIESLNEIQLETFLDIIDGMKAEFDALNTINQQLISECNKLKKEIKFLKGKRNAK